MRNYLYIILLLVFVSCRGGHEQFVSDADLTIDIILPTTPVKDQGTTSLCWVYAMLATIETDCLAHGDSVNLSPVWLMRHSLEEQAVQSYLTANEPSDRGTLMEAMRLFEKYGIIGYDAMPLPSSSGDVICKKLKYQAQTMSAQRLGLDAFREAVGETLDNTVGPMPRYVFMYGMEYTPLEFARSCAMPGQWHAYTSFTHHPFNEPFCLEITDNRQCHEAMNVPIDTLYQMVVNSLMQRHPVAWEGALRKDKSEKIKDKRSDFQDNLPTVAHHHTSGPASNDCQSARQKAFERFQLTDDHCMAIVGMGHRKDGTQVFICKNSWGREDGNNGFRYMTKEEFLLNTIVVMVRE